MDCAIHGAIYLRFEYVCAVTQTKFKGDNRSAIITKEKIFFVTERESRMLNVFLNR